MGFVAVQRARRGNLLAQQRTDRAEAFCAGRMRYLQRLKGWPTFGKGWTARVAGVRMLALQMASGN